MCCLWEISGLCSAGDFIPAKQRAEVTILTLETVPLEVVNQNMNHGSYLLLTTRFDSLMPLIAGRVGDLTPLPPGHRGCPGSSCPQDGSRQPQSCLHSPFPGLIRLFSVGIMSVGALGMMGARLWSGAACKTLVVFKQGARVDD